MNIGAWFDYSNYFKDSAIIAGFTDKHFPYFPPNDRIEFSQVLGLNPENLVKLRQIHSNIVKICLNPGEILDIDGIVTKNHDLVLSIQVADCIPIYISDFSNNTIGLVHAGWRGVSKGIISNIVSILKNINSDIRKTQILLGPSIRQCCFEIGSEVAELFETSFQITGKNNKSFLDLQGTVIKEFEENGIASNQINDIGECTCCSKRYHSYRRDGKSAGRMIAIIGYKND